MKFLQKLETLTTDPFCTTFLVESLMKNRIMKIERRHSCGSAYCTSMFPRHLSAAVFASSSSFSLRPRCFLYAISTKMRNTPATIPPATIINTPAINCGTEMWRGYKTMLCLFFIHKETVCQYFTCHVGQA